MTTRPYSVPDRPHATADCAHPSGRPIFPAIDYVTGEMFEVRHCLSCGLTVTWPPMNDAALDRYYSDGYYGTGSRYGRLMEWGLSLLYRRRAARVERHVGRPARVLDVGCGPGLLLSEFRRRGWTATGIERTTTAGRSARELLGLAVHIGDWRTSALPAAAFEAVVIWHVLEHIDAPADLLRWTAERLVPGGVLLVGVPNIASAEARWAGAAWFHLDVPRHRIHFTPATLAALVARAGLSVETRGSSAPEYDLFSAVQSVLNRLGVQPNLLYGLIRRSDARPASRARSVGGAVASVLLAPPLAVAALVWTLLAGWCGAGATMTYLCRKPAGPE